MKNLKRTLSLTPIDNSINEDAQGLQDPQWLLRRKLTLFSFLVMVYDRVGDGDKISKENFTASHLKIDAKVFFSKTVMLQCISWIPLIVTDTFLKSPIVAHFFFCKQQRLISRTGNVFTPKHWNVLKGH